MTRVSAKLRSFEGGFSHWCPGCRQTHLIPTSAPYKTHWSFDGNLDAPTFGPSVKVTGKKLVMVDDEWTGGWERDADGNPIDYCCHYFLIGGQLQFCGDSTHELAGQTVPLPDLPPSRQDKVNEALRDRLDLQSP